MIAIFPSGDPNGWQEEIGIFHITSCSLSSLFSQEKWQYRWITKPSVGSYRERGSVPGFQMDTGMHKTFPPFPQGPYNLGDDTPEG